MTLNNTSENNKQPNELGMITFKEGADMLGIGIATFKKLVDDGRIPRVNLTDKLDRVLKKNVEDYVNNQIEPRVEATANKEEMDDLAKARMATELAQEELKKVQFETQAKLAQHGWSTVDEALKANEKEKEKLKAEREELEKGKSTYADQVAKCTLHINQSNEHRKMSEEMVRQSKERLQEAVYKEAETKKTAELAGKLIATLQDCYQYYIENIIPVIREIQLIKKAVYKEAQSWQSNERLWSLQQYLSNRMENIDIILENVFEVKIPEELTLPVEKITELEAEPIKGESDVVNT